MSAPVVSAVHLRKEYHLGAASRGYMTFREAIGGLVTAPLRAFSRGERTGAHAHAASETLRALDDVSFAIARGETVAIVGQNGAGKSTVLKILSRITEPTSGSVTIRGRVASLLEVGTGFHPELTGRENVYLNGSLLGMGKKEIDRKFDAIVDFAEVEQFLDTPVKRYSSGMYVRLAFAVAAHVEPDVLIVDEVLAVGDAAFQQKCLGTMERASGSGRTVIFVSHNMAAVTRLCPRAILLSRGRIVFDGQSREAARRYLGDGSTGPRLHRDLAGVRRRIEPWGESMRLADIICRPENGTAFSYREPLRFRVEFVATCERKGVGVGIGIDDFSGARIATCNSDEEGVTIDTQVGRRYAFEITMAAPCLRPGSYGLSCAVVTGDHLYDFVASAVSFEVTAVEAISGRNIPITEGSGPLALDGSWRVGEVRGEGMRVAV